MPIRRAGEIVARRVPAIAPALEAAYCPNRHRERGARVETHRPDFAASTAGAAALATR